MRSTFDKHILIIAAFTITVIPVIIYQGGEYTVMCLKRPCSTEL
jgi:hypothetical protein